MAPQDAEGMRHLSGVRIHSVPPCRLPQTGNVKCGYGDQLVLWARDWRGSWEAGLPELKPGMSQSNQNELVILGMDGLTPSNLFSCWLMSREFSAKWALKSVALSVQGDLESWPSFLPHFLPGGHLPPAKIPHWSMTNEKGDNYNDTWKCV